MKELDSMIIKWRENSPRWKARLKDAPLTPHQIAIKQECAEKGHWVIGSDPPKGQDSLIRISMHGPPAAFDREGYMHCHNYFETVSYTHLDVYKRQSFLRPQDSERSSQYHDRYFCIGWCFQSQFPALQNLFQKFFLL